MECPYCEQELDYHDYYGLGIPGKSDFKKIGEIYKCPTEECESEVFNYHFHTDSGGSLREGYPC